MKVITREQAKTNGLKRFYTGKPCKRGHVCERFTGNRTCVLCNKINSFTNENPLTKDKVNARKTAKANGDVYYNTGIPCINGHVCERYTSSGACVECQVSHRAKHEKLHGKAYRRAKYKNGGYTKWKWSTLTEKQKEKQRARQRGKRYWAGKWRLREQYVKERTIRCKENIKKINELYKACPKGYHVDHIVPLRGINVSGLHAWWNLAIIPASENMAKGNRHTVEIETGEPEDPIEFYNEQLDKQEQ